MDKKRVDAVTCRELYTIVDFWATCCSRCRTKGFHQKMLYIGGKKMLVAQPVGLMNTLTPKKWKLNSKVVNFDWS